MATDEIRRQTASGQPGLVVSSLLPRAGEAAVSPSARIQHFRRSTSAGRRAHRDRWGAARTIRITSSRRSSGRPSRSAKRLGRNPAQRDRRDATNVARAGHHSSGIAPARRTAAGRSRPRTRFRSSRGRRSMGSRRSPGIQVGTASKRDSGPASGYTGAHRGDQRSSRRSGRACESIRPTIVTVGP